MIPIIHFLNKEPKEQKYRFVWKGNKSILPKYNKPMPDLQSAF